MYDIFTPYAPKHKDKHIYFGEFEYAKRMYLANLNDVKAYYRTHQYRVKSNHFLATMLSLLTMPDAANKDVYVDSVTSDAWSVARRLNMTTSKSHGILHRGVFFGPLYSELILYDTSSFDIDEDIKNWTKVDAVRVLSHDKSDLGMMLPNGKMSGNETGLAVVSVNIPRLALQYRSFKKHYAIHSTSTFEPTVEHFIAMFVLPNTLDTSLNICVMNRFMCLVEKRPFTTSLFRHPVAVKDYHDKLDAAMHKIDAYIRTTSDRYDVCFALIPSFTVDDTLESLAMPDISLTSTVYWALWLTRLKYMLFMLDYRGDRGLVVDRDLVTSLRNSAMSISSARVYQSALSGWVGLAMENDLKRVMALTKK